MVAANVVVGFEVQKGKVGALNFGPEFGDVLCGNVGCKLQKGKRGPKVSYRLALLDRRFCEFPMLWR